MFKKVKKQPFNIKLKETFTNYKIVLNCALAAAKKLHFANEIKSNDNDTRKNWKLINNFLNRRQKSHTPKTINNGAVLSSEIDILDAFSNHFAASPLITSTATNINRLPRRTSNSFFLFPADISEISDLILSSKNCTAGMDKIDSWKIKLVEPIISPVFTYIVNLIFNV